MQSLVEQLTTIFGDAFAAASYDRRYGEVVVSNRPDLGDFQCNGALPAAKEYKQQPRQIAQNVIDALAEKEIFEEVVPAGPGFINIRLSDDFLSGHVARMAADERLGCAPTPEPLTVVLDYGGPNVAKYMHVGHLRPSIIGDSLRRIFRFRGDNVVGDIHLGDWGTQMGMLINEVERHYPDLPYFDPDYSGPYPAESPVTMEDLQVMYPAASARVKADEEAAEAARRATRELHQGRPGYRALWQHFRDISLAALREDVEMLDVHFDLWLGESDTNERIESLVNSLLAEGHAQESQGAIVVPVQRPDDKAEIPPLVLLKSDGAMLYTTTDLATIAQRMADYRPDAILYVVDARQSLHFEQVFRVAYMAHIVPPEVSLEHLAFGTMNGPDGKPFKTRAGDVPLLRELINMVMEKAQARLEEMEVAQDYSEEERATIAQQVGLATLKFADLVNHRTKDYIFDLERVSSFEGRTGPYLLYSAVRVKSILRRATEQGLAPGEILPPAGPEERELMLKLAEWPDVFAHSYNTRAPNHLADYVYNLAIIFNRFYREYHILNEPDAARQASWLALISYALGVIELVLDLLGIEVPDRM